MSRTLKTNQASGGEGRAGSAGRTPRHLGQLLCARGLLTEQQLQQALDHQKEAAPGKLLGEILVDMELVSPEHVTEQMAAVLDIPYLMPRAEQVQAEAVSMLPPDFLESRNLLPLSAEGGRLKVAVENFTDVFLVEDIRRRACLPVDVVAATGASIRKVRQAVMSDGAAAKEESSQALSSIVDEIAVEELKVVEEEHDSGGELEVTASDSPVVKLVNYIIHNAAEGRASDIHIEPEDTCFRVRYRVDGRLVEAVRPAKRLLAAVVSRIKIMAGMDISERRLPQDGGFTVMLAQRPIDLRVSTMAAKLGEKVVMRLVDREASIQKLDKLGFTPGMLAEFRSVVGEAHGIVLVTGPTGSGKSTTLYGALSEIVSATRNISTIEDPVERQLKGANQFQVNSGAGFTLARALRALLRQDPDVLMVGEIRDCETANLAMEAALTGHLVLSTLHTNDAPTAVPRLINMGVEPYLLAATLRGVLAQRLVRRICPHCREQADLTPVQRESIRRMYGGECPLDVVYRGRGCKRCRDQGYFGRAGVFEMLRLNEEMLTGIVRDGRLGHIRELARRYGFVSMVEDGLEKVRQGEIGIEGLLEVVSSHDAAGAMQAATGEAAGASTPGEA